MAEKGLFEVLKGELVGIKSPANGIFHFNPNVLFAELGLLVDSGTVIGTISMIGDDEDGIELEDLDEPVKAGIIGRIVETLVVDGESVECGQVLFRAKPE